MTDEPRDRSLAAVHQEEGGLATAEYGIVILEARREDHWLIANEGVDRGLEGAARR